MATENMTPCACTNRECLEKGCQALASSERAKVDTPSGTFTLDPWHGHSYHVLKGDVRRLSRGAHEWQRIAHLMGLLAPEAITKLPGMYRERLEALIEAYKD